MGGKSFCFWPKKPFKFLISARKSLRISAKTFFFRDHLFLAVKTIEISDFGQKNPSGNGEDFFFWRSPVFGRKNRLNYFFENLGQVRLWNTLPKNPGYVLVLH